MPGMFADSTDGGGIFSDLPGGDMAGPQGGGINSPGDAPNPFADAPAGGDGAPKTQDQMLQMIMGSDQFKDRFPPGFKPVRSLRASHGPMVFSDENNRKISIWGDFSQVMEELGFTDNDMKAFGDASGEVYERGADGQMTSRRGNSQERAAGRERAKNPGSAAAAAARNPNGGNGGATYNGGAASGGGANNAPGAASGSQSGSGSAAGGGFAGPGDQSIDPNAPLGLDFSGAGGSVQGGQAGYVDDVFGRPTPFTDGLGPDATLNEIMLGAMGEQRAGRDLALGISGGLASGFENNDLRQAAEGSALDLVNNPFSLDDQTIARIQGQQGDLIGRNAERLQQASAARAASSGISRSGIQNAAQDRIDINAARQLGDSQRGLLVEQATRRPQEQAQALAAGSNVLGSQQQQRGQIARGAIDTLANTNLSADAAVLGTLAAGGTPQVNLAGGGYKDSRENPASGFNPF